MGVPWFGHGHSHGTAMPWHGRGMHGGHGHGTAMAWPWHGHGHGMALPWPCHCHGNMFARMRGTFGTRGMCGGGPEHRAGPTQPARLLIAVEWLCYFMVQVDILRLQELICQSTWMIYCRVMCKRSKEYKECTIALHLRPKQDRSVFCILEYLMKWEQGRVVMKPKRDARGTQAQDQIQ